MEVISVGSSSSGNSYIITAGGRTVILDAGLPAKRITEALEQLGVKARVMSAVAMQPIAEPFVARDAVKYLEDGEVVIFGCGTGCPFFSTDTTAALRAAEIEADAMFMAKNVDYIYTADPKKDPNARKLEKIAASEVLAMNLKALDATATAFCLSNGMPIHVFGLKNAADIVKAVKGDLVGTVVTPD